MKTQALEEHIGALVRDEATGFVGHLASVLKDLIDPYAPRTSKPRDVAFIRPFGGGREHEAMPYSVWLVDTTQGTGCPHPKTEEKDGKTICSVCREQIYL
ncbi:hypothetical protein [Streptomyces sp. NPDC048172]|uniref:hypothetical protein n=1 Tax=Streptomyces sp. NPDC048172 TaxID=3365505 RepID=UPI003714CE26